MLKHPVICKPCTEPSGLVTDNIGTGPACLLACLPEKLCQLPDVYLSITVQVLWKLIRREECLSGRQGHSKKVSSPQNFDEQGGSGERDRPKSKQELGTTRPVI